MKMRILAFGIVKEFFKAPFLNIELEDSITVADFKHRLESTYPDLKKLRSYLVAKNEEYANDTEVLNQGDEIAIIPPVSGG
ncbi:MoaD/ThiS family protein [Niabella sp. CC-SYL272]|uniref:MoaD/ThiS family protein n=1 Tax=Niabella agricola TaxID=2891571 RepID=UPI001F29E805|nr:MoaD/ThiS family protein [Niabella agricola]MCF3110647.1 MoaD/ThiS family protein [Niabella agricola]